MATNLPRDKTCGQCHYFEVFCESKLDCEAWEILCIYNPCRFRLNERGYSVKELRNGNKADSSQDTDNLRPVPKNE